MGIVIVRRIAAMIAVVLGIVWTGLAETVENVRGQQRENYKLVDIYYDLNDTYGGTYYVEVEVVGRTSDVNASSFSGDVGEGVTPGQNRHIVWDAGADWPGNKGEVKAIVTAIKGGKPNKVQLWEGGPYWADRNIGASSPEDYGLYFWWGDTVGYKRVGNAWVANDGSSSNFVFNSITPISSKSITSLQNEGWISTANVLMPKHDAAHVQWGSRWRMPTEQELNDLNNKCDWTWTTMNGIRGRIVCGRDKYSLSRIFLPAAGDGYSTSLRDSGSTGRYWSSVLSDYTYDKIPYFLHVNSGFHLVTTVYSELGMSIRPVQ